MKLEITYTAQDFDEVFKIKWPEEARKRRRAAWLSGIYLVVIFGLLVIFAFGDPFSWGRRPNAPWTPSSVFNWRQKDLTPFVVALACAAGWSVYYASRRRRKPGAAYFASHPMAQQPWTIVFGDDSIDMSSPLNSAQYRWVSFTNWQETPNLFALRLTGRTGFFVVPKRFATDEQQKQLRDLFRTRIVTPTGAFPVTIEGDSQQQA